MGLAITLVCGLVYFVVQQNYRTSANDPQIQIAEDTADLMEQGASASAMIPNHTVDIAKRLAPYAIVYDNTGNVLASSAQLDGKTPELPSGVFDFVRSHGQTRFTWQPKAGVRSAVAVVSYRGGKGGFVLAGKSLREVETREKKLLVQMVLGWAFIMAATFAAVVAFMFLKIRFSKLLK